MLSRPAPGTFCFLPEESVLTLLLQLSDPIGENHPRGGPGWEAGDALSPLPAAEKKLLWEDSVGFRVEVDGRAR